MRDAPKRAPGQKAAVFSEKGWRMVRLWNTLLILAESGEPLSASRVNELVHRNYPFNMEGARCSVQTTIEDLKTLVNCNFPVARFDHKHREISEEDLGPGKFKNTTWGLRAPSSDIIDRLSPLVLPSASDIAGLALCRAFMALFSDSHSSLSRYLERFLGELQINLNHRLRHTNDFANDLPERIVRLGRKYIGKPIIDTHWMTLATAIGSKKIIIGRYRNRNGEEIDAVFAPIALWFADGRSYVLTAKPVGGDSLRIWRTDRFTGLRIDQTKDAPDIHDREIDAAIRNSFKGFIGEPTNIRLKVSPTAAYLFHEFEYHPSQVISKQKDGSLQVELKCSVGWGLEEWILGFGELITVLHPPELRSRIAARIDKMMRHYQPVAPPCHPK